MKPHFSFLLLCFFITAHSWAQPTFSITLKVEDTSDYTAYHNEPLIFTTSLVNKSLQQDLEWNQAADAWLAEVTADYQAGKLSKEEFEKETQLVTAGKKQVKADSIGTHRSPWFRQLRFRVLLNDNIGQAPWPIKILGDPVTEPVAVLDAKGYYLVMHHLSPARVLKLKPGVYKIQVGLAGVWSNEVMVKIRQQNIPVRVLNTSEMQLRLGNYYLERKDADKALDYATAVLKKDPKDISALVLSGESYILKKDYRRALVYFDKALQQHRKEFPGLPEQPLYLDGTIAWLKGKLKK
jgi:tetratricopeptide (TPR) repeat protein